LVLHRFLIHAYHLSVYCVTDFAALGDSNETMVCPVSVGAEPNRVGRVEFGGRIPLVDFAPLLTYLATHQGEKHSARYTQP